LGQGDKKNHGHVGYSTPPVDKHLQHRKEDDSGEESGFRRNTAPREPHQQQRCSNRRYQRMEACTGLIDAQESVACPHEPIGEHRLVESEIAVEVRDYPLMPVNHFYGGAGKTGFVPVYEGNRTQPGTEQYNPAEDYDGRLPAYVAGSHADHS